MPDVQTGDPQDYLKNLGLVPQANIDTARSGLTQKYQDIGTQETSAIRDIAAKRNALIGKGIGAPKDPTLQNIPKAPGEPQYSDPFTVFQNPAVMLATLGSLFTRAPLTAAMNAGAAAMEAKHAGEKEKYEQQRQAWKDSTEQAINQNKVELEKYNAAWKRTDLAVQDRLARLQALAAGEKDEIMIAAIGTGQVDRLDKILDIREKANDQLKHSILQYEIQEQNRVANQAPDKIAFNKWLQEYKAKNNGQSPSSEEMAKRVQEMKTPVVAIDPETRDFMARQLIAGNTSALTGLFRTSGAKIEIEKAAKDILINEKKMNPDAAASFVVDQANKFMGERRYQTTAGAYAARVESATNEVAQLIPQALETSRSLPRGLFVPLNKLLQLWQEGTSDPSYNDFIFANFSLINAYARAMNPTGTPHVNDKLEAKAVGLLSVATDKKAYEVQVRRLWKEVEASKQAQSKTRQGLSPPAEFPAPPGDNSGWKIEKIE